MAALLGVGWLCGVVVTGLDILAERAIMRTGDALANQHSRTGSRRSSKATDVLPSHCR
jgi:hypothetical protein